MTFDFFPFFFLLIIFKIKKLITTKEYGKKFERYTMFKIYI